MTIKSKLKKLWCRAWGRRLPRVLSLTALDSRGVSFEATNALELHRIVNLGDESEYLAAMLAALGADDVLYDIGANIGLVSLHAARICRTVAFEPDPAFFLRLRRNLELNPRIPVEALPFAICDTNSRVTLFTDGAEGGSPSLVHQRGEQGAAAVAAHSLDALVATGSLPRPTVLKLDIEGAEILALRGGEALLRGPQAPRALFLEVHDTFLPAFGSSSAEVLALVRQAGYETVCYEARRADQRHLILTKRI